MRYQKNIISKKATLRLAFYTIRLDGKLEFTNEYERSAKLCVPAAYTNDEGGIICHYIIEGKLYGTRKPYSRISLHKDGFSIGRGFISSNGFQQHALVKNGKKNSFPRDDRERFRRALCMNEDKVMFIVNSRYPMTLDEFAALLEAEYTDAVNLDMGDFGFGWYKYRILSGWAFYNRSKQTNWLIIR